MTLPQGDGWSEYERLVLSELERHTSELESIRTELSGLRTTIEVLKIKVALIGITAGLLAGGVASAIVTALLR